MKEGYKQCPYCSEEIKKEARKCRYCHEFLDENLEIKDDFIGNESNIGFSRTVLMNGNYKNKKKGMTGLKRFGKYILYLFRDWIIFLVLDAITKGFGIWRHNTYDDSHFAFDMFVCFIIFIVETVRLISDCSKIKKGTYEEQL